MNLPQKDYTEPIAPAPQLSEESAGDAGEVCHAFHLEFLKSKYRGRIGFGEWLAVRLRDALARQPQHAEIMRNVRDLETLGLRRKIHILEAHNQYFERCESAWCNPTDQDFCQPAIECAKEYLKNNPRHVANEAQHAEVPAGGQEHQNRLFCRKRPSKQRSDIECVLVKGHAGECYMTMPEGHPAPSPAQSAEAVRAAALAIGEDLSDRCGLKWEWEMVDTDVREECYAAWETIIRSASTPAPTPPLQAPTAAQHTIKENLNG